MPKKELYLFECKLCLDQKFGTQTCYMLQIVKESPNYCPVVNKTAEWQFKGNRIFEFSREVG